MEHVAVPEGVTFETGTVGGIPGWQKANIVIWSAQNAVQLTEASESQPIWPLVTLKVTLSATHPLFTETARDGQDA